MQQYAAVHLGLHCLPMFPVYSPVLNSLHAGKFFSFCRLLIFFKIVFYSQNFFHEYHKNVKSFPPDWTQHFAGPNLGPN